MEREEQLKLARQLLESGVLSEESASAIKADFPELAESEDERIRKMLVEQMERWKKCAEDNNVEQDVKDASASIAYLEKQKEQKPESCDCSRDEESYTNGIHHVLMNPEAYGLIKQKPAKWSEEDEERLNSIIESYKVLLKDYKACHDVDYIPYNSDTVIRNVVDNVKFLKSLRPQPRWKPSEEQMCELNWASKLSPVLESLYNDLKKL